MERNREGRRSAATTVGPVPSITRRPRVKDTSDDEDRMEETVDSRLWERSKKERLTAFHVSSMNARNKRKRQLLPQETQAPGGRLSAVVEDADESVEETEAQVSEDDDEPPPPPLLRRPGPGKARVHSKEDDIVMDIPAVPRKARSSMSASSRYSSMARRQMEIQHPEVPRQKSAISSHMPLNGSSSSNFLQKQGRKLKPVGPKVRAMKVPKIAEVSTLSDEEAEVAEALFDLSRSVPSHLNVLEAKLEVKMESEVRTGSPPTGQSMPMGGSTSHIHGLHHPVSTANGYVAPYSKDVIAPTTEAPKRKRPRVVVKSEDGKISTPIRSVSSAAMSSASPSRPHQSGVGEAELDSLPAKFHADLATQPSDPVTVKDVTDAAVCEVKKELSCVNDNIEQGELIAPKQEQQSIVEKGDAVIDSSGEGADTVELPKGNDKSTSELGARSVGALLEDESTAKLNIDLMASPLKHNIMEEDASGSTIDRKDLGDNSFILSPSFTGQSHTEDQAKLNLVPEDAEKAMDVGRGLSLVKEKLDGVDQELISDGEQQAPDVRQMDQASTQSGREEEGREKESSVKSMLRPQEEVSDNAAATPFVPSTIPVATSSSAAIPLSGWMGGLPHLGYYGPGAPPWAAGASLPSPGIDVKAAHSAMQLPHGSVLPPPVQRMKRCATHVFIALFIYRDQQVSRQSIWSAALCRAAPYNLNIPPVNILDNDKLGGHYLDPARKSSAQQSGPSYGYSIAQGSGLGMTSSGTPNTAGAMPGTNHASSAGVSGDIGNASGTGTTSSNVMAVHAQYLQAMMQQNGFASFPFPFGGPHAQAAQFFNSPYFQPHLMHPPVPQVQALAQQSGNVLKQQQGVGSLAHSNSQLVAPPLQQQLQLQLAPQSPSQTQQPHNNVGMSAQQFGIHSDKENAAGVESASTAESRLSALQRSMVAQQGPSTLPNLNVGASPLMLGNSLPGMPSHDQDGSSLVSPGGKHSGKAQPQFQGQNPSSLSSSMHPQQFTTGSASGLQMKVLDPTLSQGYSTLARGTVSPGNLGLVSSMMGTPSLGGLPGAVDGSKGSGQQQPVYGGHAQHFQRSMTKAPPIDDAYAIKARDYTDDKRNTMKSVGASALISRVDMEVSSPSLQGSPTSGSAAPNARLAGAIGRAINSGTPSDVRSSRSVSSVGSGQVPLLQNQPALKQAMGRAKPGSGSGNVAAAPVGSHSVNAYTERVLPGNLGKFSGAGLPYSAQMVSNQSSKPVHTGVTKVGQRMSPGPAQQQIPNAALTKSHVQQARSNQAGVSSTPRMLPSVTSPVLPAGAIAMSTPHSLSVSKASTVTTSKSPSNGKGSVSVTKAGHLSKKPPVSGPAISSGLSPVQQNMTSRPPAQQKGSASAVHVPQFHQQQSAISSQQQRLPTTKSQVYPQLQAQQGQYKQPFQGHSAYRPQIFLQQPYMQQQPPQQQQAVPQHQQASVSQHYLPSSQSSSQHSQAQASQSMSHLQQQFPPVAGSNGLPLSSPNLTLGSAVSGNITSSTSLDGVGLKMNPTKTGYASANPLASGGIPEVISAAHSTASGQVSSPLSGSSSYLQLAAVKTSEQKPLVSDVANNREDITISRHLASPSSSQAAAASNPSCS